ncbi:hypothetical protein PspLS_07033 [Pyricularia sp. CBS 133598]|nr:hypothetical protein PspLS_07033 [Pyricularia sp. CBS 133598]
MSSSRPWIEVARSVPTNLCPNVGAVLVWASAAATQMKAPCTKKSSARLDLRTGPRKRDTREKKKQPNQKDAMDARHLIQSLGSSAGMWAAPRARKSVLPGPASVRDVTNEKPPQYPYYCYILDTSSCTDVQIAALRAGTAVIRDFIMVDPPYDPAAPRLAARDHRGGHLVEPQRTARDDLAAKLEREQRDRQAHKHVVLEAVDRGRAVRADEPLPKRRSRVGLGQRGRDADEGSLHQEKQRQAGFAYRAEEARHAREEEAAKPKGRHGRQALDPKLGLVSGDVGGAEGQEERIARLLGFLLVGPL